MRVRWPQAVLRRLLGTGGGGCKGFHCLVGSDASARYDNATRRVLMDTILAPLDLVTEAALCASIHAYVESTLLLGKRAWLTRPRVRARLIQYMAEGGAPITAGLLDRKWRELGARDSPSPATAWLLTAQVVCGACATQEPRAWTRALCAFAAPVFDREVTVNVTHMNKLPFALNLSTGKLALPLSFAALCTFDPGAMPGAKAMAHDTRVYDRWVPAATACLTAWLSVRETQDDDNK